ncbi:MAG: PA0069 family radical SAM protein [Acidobacteriota bacterium]
MTSPPTRADSAGPETVRGAATVRGRGAGFDPQNRFERLEVLHETPAEEAITTTLFRDASRSVISRNRSPDIPFDASLNPYRGCEHGCSYCYARPSHEYLGLSAGLDFESKILVKDDAPELLRRELTAPRWRAQTLAMSGVTDAYQPIEKRLGITRGCVEVLAELRHPLAIVTKNALVTRDLDLLQRLAAHQAVSVSISITTLDPELSAGMEPRASAPRRRLEAVARLAAAGVPVGVGVAPLVPGLNDHEIPAILDAAAEAGATFAGFTVLRLPGAVAQIFDDWLERTLPDRRKKILARVRSMRSGALHDARFGHRMRGEGFFAEQVAQLFEIARRKHGLARRGPRPSPDAFRRPNQQLSIFG